MTGRIPEGFDAHVLVVGAGPTGLLLAAELRLGGASVILLEAGSAPSTESRATILNARTIEILDSRGLLPQLGEVVHESRSHFGGIPFDLGSTQQWYVPQPVTERVLRDWGLELGVDLRWRHLVEAIEVAADGVTVGTTNGARLRALCVVGCDGQHSTVRRLSTAGFPEPAQPRELIRADVAGVDIPNRRFQRLPNGLAVAARRPDGKTRVMVHRFGQLARSRTGAPEFAELVETWRQVTGEDLSGGTLCWINAFEDVQQQLSRYRHGRVILAGDAAHQQLQVGGQALNLALQDAFNLGWKLALHVTGRAGPGLLDSYSDERYAADRTALTNIEAQAMLLLDGPRVEPLRAVLTELLALDPVRNRLARQASGLTVGYPVGTGKHPLLGARLPDLELRTPTGVIRTLQLLRSGQPVFLQLSGDPGYHAATRRALAGWLPSLLLATGTPVDPDGPLAEVPGALIRPDGHVCWLGSNLAELTEAAGRWLGLPAEPPPDFTEQPADGKLAPADGNLYAAAAGR